MRRSNSITTTMVSGLLICMMFIFSCGGEDNNDPISTMYPSADFVDTGTFSFTAEIAPETLTQEQGFSLYSSWSYIREGTYTITSQQDIDAFNQTLDVNEIQVLNDLDFYTYFFIRDYTCCQYYEYSDHSYSNGILTIELNHFLIPACGCAAVLVEDWLVFRAEKFIN